MRFVWKPGVTPLSDEHMFSSYKREKMHESVLLIGTDPPCLIIFCLLQVELSYCRCWSKGPVSETC